MQSDKSQLVSQHLENISRTALGKYQHIFKEYAKGRHGVLSCGQLGIGAQLIGRFPEFFFYLSGVHEIPLGKQVIKRL